jgi:hypothetical protein
MRPRLFALLKSRAIPGWLVFLWGIAERTERIEYLNEKRRQMWEFAVTPSGHTAISVAGFLWLIGVVLWPDIKKWWRGSSDQSIAGMSDAEFSEKVWELKKEGRQIKASSLGSGFTENPLNKSMWKSTVPPTPRPTDIGRGSHQPQIAGWYDRAARWLAATESLGLANVDFQKELLPGFDEVMERLDTAERKKRGLPL